MIDASACFLGLNLFERARDSNARDWMTMAKHLLMALVPGLKDLLNTE